MRSRYALLEHLFLAFALLIGGIVLLLSLPGFEGARPVPGRVASAGPNVQLAFLASGRLAELYITEGEEVVAGQLLARLDSAPLAARRDELTRELEAAKARLLRLQAQIDYPAAPPAMSAEALAAYHLWAEQMRALETETQITTAALENRSLSANDRRNLLFETSALLEDQQNRLQTLTEQGLLSGVQLDSARVSQLESRRALSEQDAELETLEAQIHLQNASLTRQMASLRLQSLADFDLAERRLSALQQESQSLEIELQNHSLHAPSAGQILSLDVTIGQSLAAGVPFATFEQGSAQSLKAALPPDLRLGLGLGDVLRVIPAHAALEGFESEIVAISPDLHEKEGHASFLLTLALPPEQALARGTPVQVLLPQPQRNAFLGLLAPLSQSFNARAAP